VFSKTILPLAQKKVATPFQMIFAIKAVLMPSSFRAKAIICDESDRLPEPNKVKLTATLLQNIGFLTKYVMSYPYSMTHSAHKTWPHM
jgi:hypothetical protein